MFEVIADLFDLVYEGVFGIRFLFSKRFRRSHQDRFSKFTNPFVEILRFVWSVLSLLFALAVAASLLYLLVTKLR